MNDEIKIKSRPCNLASLQVLHPACVPSSIARLAISP